MLYEKVVRNHIDYMIPHNLLVYALGGLTLLYFPYLLGALIIGYCLTVRVYWVVAAVLGVLLAIYLGYVEAWQVLIACLVLIVVHTLILDRVDTLFGYILTNTAWVLDKRMGRQQQDLIPPQLNRENPRVSIILCNKDEEPRHLLNSIHSLHASRAYAENRLGLSAIRLVLADGGSRNLDSGQIRPLLDEIYMEGHGKLTDRDRVTRSEDCDIVVATDSDKVYAEDCIERLLRPLLEDSELVAVSADEWELPFGFGTGHYRFNGGCSAYFRKIYELTPFDLSVDQYRYKDIWYEEEFLFLTRLLRYGKTHHFTERNREQRPVSLIVILKRFLGLKHIGQSF